MKKVFIYSFLVLTASLMAITIGADGGYYEAKVADSCKKENAECEINESGKDCCDGLVCIPFNAVSGNGKCAKIITTTPKITPTVTPTPIITISPTTTPVSCEPIIVINGCEYQIIEN